ncbi:high nitrogen upregulated cytochrome P450 monooxygenase 2 [Phellopilus nigrolimitatus]|nr:high nitrogen upregulated cytochrome P450 monooxygenase 2 [Phellopilus nigrolimitatus]
MGTTTLPGFGLPDISLRDALVTDVACALLVHAIYKRYELDIRHILSNSILLVFAPAVPAFFFTSHFPEFFLALWMMAKGKNHIYHKELHDQYGQYVRVGPNELSIVDANAIPYILGADGMPKGPMWSARSRPGTTPALIAIRTVHEHARRRRPWNRAFNTGGVKGYEPIVAKRALQLVGELEKHKSEVDLASWFIFFTTDFMGDMVFGGGFELMCNGGDKEGVFTMLQAAMEPLAILHHLPWLVYLLFRIPGLTENMDRHRLFCNEKVQMRSKNGSLSKDLFSYLIDETGVEKTPPTEEEIISNGQLAVVAGADTTSSTLGGIFYYLLRNPNDYRRLQKEVDNVFPPGEGDPFDSTKLMKMQFLDAVINETLRLQPAVATYLQRAPEAGSGGKWVGDRFIPEGTAVVIPPYALHRDSRYFRPLPDTFLPERWLRSSAPRDPKVITDTAAFIPFSYDPANCAGRSLALTELRMVVALIIQRYEIRFADETKLEDWFTMKNGKLPVVLTSKI